MKLAIAADHGGYNLKEEIKDFCKESNIETTDLGNEVYDPKDDYPDFSIKLGKAVGSGEFDRGILICGSGVGANIAANKINGARASVCHDTYSARQGVEHDDMNILCLGARIIAIELAKELVTAFVNAKFTVTEDRFIRRLEKVRALEK